jgi:hypothetical protein
MNKQTNKPTPEEKCEHEKHCFFPDRPCCCRITSPSPEARVDWNGKASEIWAKILEAKSWQGMTEMKLLECLHNEWFTVISAAFEKGREAR